MPIVLGALALAAAALATPATPAVRPPATATASPVATNPVTGFRSAHFRMSKAEVRRAIAADFPGLPIAERLQPTEGTTVLEVVAPMLDPGPGPAVISYVVGATTQTLAQVAVVWATKATATPDERAAIAIAGLRLNQYLRASGQRRKTLDPKPLKGGAVSLYGALDDRGAGVELVASGVPFSAGGVAAPPPTGPAALRLTYMANPANPDVKPRPSPTR